MKKRRIFAIGLLVLFAGFAVGCGVGTRNDSGRQTQTETAQSTALPVKTSPLNGEIYKNGTYTGIGYGKNGAVEIKIRIENDRIVNLEVVSHHDTADYFDRVWESVSGSVLAQGSADLEQVDQVSGATASSNGIIHAIQSALYKARR